MIIKQKDHLIVSIFFSGLIHVMWISAISIVIAPNIKLRDKFTEVSFLGPILEKTAFEMMVEESKPITETLYRTSMDVRTDRLLNIEGPKRSRRKNVFFSRDKRGKRIIAGADSGLEKEKPSYALGRKSIYYHIRDKGINNSLEGPAGKRELLFKPDLPIFHKRAFIDEDHLVVKFRFIVSKDGVVERVEPVIFSGDPHVDLKCIKYLKQWKFAPRHYGQNSEKDWGLIRLDIKVR